MSRLALSLLLVGTQRHYLYEQAPVDWRPDVWNICGSATILWMLWVAVLSHRKSVVLLMVATWLTLEELLVSGCSALWLISPWAVQPGEEQCSARIGFRIGTIGIAVVAVLAWKLCTSSYTATKTDVTK